MVKTSKQIIGVILLFITLNVTAQVGINSNDPKAVLDVVAQKGTQPDGVLIPRLTATEVQTMDSKVGEAQNSMLIYVNKTATTALTGKCKNIDSEGFYYYDHKDGQVWKKLVTKGTEYTAGAGIEITNGVVSATGLEKITQNGKTGWRLIGKKPADFVDIGTEAVDLSSNDANTYKKRGAAGNYSFATGYGTTASGDYSIAIGYGNDALGEYSVAIGASNTASETGSFVVGTGNTALGYDSTVIGGNRNIASGDNSIIIGGVDNIASGKNSVAMGKNNFDSADNLLSVGIGTNTSRQNGFIITQDGKVGIGLNTIVSNSPYKLLVNGYIISTGQQIYSDSRLKKGIQPLASGWQVVSKLRPVQYYWNEIAEKKRGQKDTQLQYGFIAQEVEKVLPNVVREVQEENNQSYKSINYTEIIPILTKTIQEQQAEIQEQKSEIQQQKELLQFLEERIKALESRN